MPRMMTSFLITQTLDELQNGNEDEQHDGDDATEDDQGVHRLSPCRFSFVYFASHSTQRDVPSRLITNAAMRPQAHCRGSSRTMNAEQSWRMVMSRPDMLKPRKFMAV